MSKILALYKKYKEVINYLVFGVLTTILTLLIYYGLTYTIIDPNNALMLQGANIISWVVAVIFAYVTNRKFVFESKSNNIIRECASFFGARIVTLIMDMIIMFIGVTVFKGNDKIFKLISQFVVIVSNYVFSKLFVFKKKKS